jgi:hypothetical protein
MIIGVYEFLSNVKRSSVNDFITIINSSVAEVSACTMKYFNDASMLYMFLTLDIRGINDIRLISNPIHAPSHELENTDTNTPPTKVISKRIFVEFLGIREVCVILYLWGMNPLAFFSLIFYVETCLLYPNNSSFSDIFYNKYFLSVNVGDPTTHKTFCTSCSVL